jgi:hypothetical protein
MGAAMSYAGFDIFFTLDKEGFLGVIFVDNMELVRSFVNHPFLSDTKAAAICAVSTYLYVACDNGELLVLDISMFLNGTVSAPTNLRSRVLKIKRLFRASQGLRSLAVVSPNAFLDLHCEDDDRYAFNAARASAQDLVRFEERKFDALEGHVLLVGSGDPPKGENGGDQPGGNGSDVLVLCPQGEHIRRLATLRGHQHAVTQVAADAAGRFYFTASAGDRRLCIWDSLSFNLEARYDRVAVSGICLGANCLFVSSYKAPFLRLWSVPERNQPHSRWPRARIEASESLAEKEEYLRGQISCSRSMRWCFSMLKGLDFSQVVDSDL